MFHFRTIVLALGLTILGLANSAAAQAGVPNNVVQLANGQLRPGPGYTWVSTAADDFRVRWQPGLAHPTLANLVSGPNPPVFVPAPGFRWANNLPNDYTVVRNQVAGPSDEALGRAVVKVLAAAVADAISQPDENDNLLDSLFRGALKVGRDSLIESAVEDVFPQLNQVELRAVRRAICLAIDGNLNEASWVRSTARDEMLAALRLRDPGLANAAQVTDFVRQVVRARQN